MPIADFDSKVAAARRRLGARRLKGASFRVCDPDTALVVEGPPRSANSFTVRMLHAVFGPPQRFKIAHHSHSPDNVLFGAAHRIPLVVLARAPEDAILSYAIYRGCTPAESAAGYVAFYETLAGIDGHVIGHFDEITGDFNAFLARLDAILPRPVPRIEDVAALVARIDAQQAAALARQGPQKDPVRRGPMPAAAREQLKDALREDVRAHLAENPRPRALYEAFLAAGDASGRPPPPPPAA